MNKIVYVNGGILIETPYFRYLNAGCLFDIPPSGADVIEPDNEIEGHPCLIITDKKAPSFFKGYYAKTFFTTRCFIAPFFSKSILDCYIEFENRIVEVLNLIFQNDVSNETRQHLYRLSLVSAVSSLDLYISDLVLFLATKDKNIFLKTAQKFCQSQSADIIARIAQMWSENILDSAEQDVIDFVLRTSYSNVKKINDDVLKALYNVSITVNSDLNEIFRLRHIIVHRSGRLKNGSIIDLEKSELLNKIEIIKTFGKQVYDLVNGSNVVKLLCVE